MYESDEKKSDQALDLLLQRASQPVPPSGADRRLLAAAFGEVAPASNVIAFRRPPPAASSSRARWIVGLPLAASLLLGILLGSSTFDSVLPDTLTLSTQAASADDELSTGIDDAETYTESGVS
jgi:hypothetical protein